MWNTVTSVLSVTNRPSTHLLADGLLTMRIVSEVNSSVKELFSKSIVTYCERRCTLHDLTCVLYFTKLLGREVNSRLNSLGPY